MLLESEQQAVCSIITFCRIENMVGRHLPLLTLAGEAATDSFSDQGRHEPRVAPDWRDPRSETVEILFIQIFQKDGGVGKMDASVLTVFQFLLFYTYLQICWQVCVSVYYFTHLSAAFFIDT